jgi:hypothetical protein
MRNFIVQYILVYLIRRLMWFGKTNFWTTEKLIASFFGPLTCEYRKRMLASGTCLLKVLYYSKLVLNIVPSFVATIHLQDLVEQKFLRATNRRNHPSTFHVFKTAQSHELNIPFALRVDHRYEIKQAVSERTRGVGFVTVVTFLTKAMCFVVISVDDFLHVRAVTRTVDSRTFNYHTVITMYWIGHKSEGCTGRGKIICLDKMAVKFNHRHEFVKLETEIWSVNC